jgi:hypothetical protein
MLAGHASAGASGVGVGLLGSLQPVVNTTTAASRSQVKEVGIYGCRRYFLSACAIAFSASGDMTS